MKSLTMEPLLRIAEVVQILRCSQSNLYAAVANGDIEHVRVGAGKAGIRFTLTQVQAFVDRRTMKAKGEVQKTPPPRKPKFKHLSLS